ncbi:hypothetical protein T479_12665 [Lysinibacillus varians]|uniref:ABC-three component system middle component 6 n=2 Tax=Lysinibacillus varians TaxID=1145276 RepID=UPI00042EF63D|nr:ABC-three component system middle component 6 [Lysinibacillus varians]AHN22094.1 hypothetical protein T479_12665 [Lysinibacillus varians]
MLLLNDLKNPQDTIMYCAACILFILKNEDKSKDIDILFDEIKVKFNKNMAYSDFILALDFLYLLEKITLDSKEKICLLEN